MNKVYIAGKVTGLPYKQVYAKFKTMQTKLEGMGFEVVNPCEITGAETAWKDAMRTCIKALMECDSICLLPCWGFSKGATIERNLALTLGMPVLEL